MKSKTARRRLTRNAWKMAKGLTFGAINPTHGLGKLWKKWTRDALSEDMGDSYDKSRPNKQLLANRRRV